jgi:hypothetical protein
MKGQKVRPDSRIGFAFAWVHLRLVEGFVLNPGYRAAKEGRGPDKANKGPGSCHIPSPRSNDALGGLRDPQRWW